MLWALRILLAAIFLLTAVGKLLGQQFYVQQFDEIGAGQWFRYFVGVVELAGAFGLLVPALSWLAAAGLAIDMAAASFVNVAILHSPLVFATVPLCIVFGVLSFTSRPKRL